MTNQQIIEFLANQLMHTPADDTEVTEAYNGAIKVMRSITRMWRCDDCKFECEMSYDDIVNVGTPICPDGNDMEML